MKNKIGIIGLGTMGKALAKNFLNKGFTVSGFNRTYSVAQNLKDEVKENFTPCKTIEDFVNSLESPRIIILMLPDGAVTDNQINVLLPLLDKGDVIADCGNSYFKNTIRRSEEINKTGKVFFGVGVSGGEKGALLGPSIMVGGKKEEYYKISSYLEAISAKKSGEPCVAYIGKDGSGHFVKMVHNGIEYADLQLLSEVYLITSMLYGMSNDEIATMFTSWNKTPAQSYLVKISSAVLFEKEVSGISLIDKIKDKVGAKGTGKWTCQTALDLGVNISTIQASVDARNTSNFAFERKFFNKELQNDRGLIGTDFNKDDLFSAYMLCKIVAYAQGFSMMKTASDEFCENFNLSEIAKIFRAGCIIQAQLLDDLMNIFDEGDYDKNFLTNPKMLKIIKENLPKLRRVTSSCISYGIPIPCFSSALIYLDQLSNKKLGANFIAAQRDYFGAHTFEVIDKEGAVHHDWDNI